ncbi:hypothetical protein GCQ56_07665 [Marinifilum sp. N1E240]|uniref:hypothetical protein n=1 Tax=Marinifilum sp. N1E240 TaxID=2608082 RepID=UPI00128BE077|nr:hypothetical protein [Marinifilum sp. N1E240]MPQ46890.1 hypothetical protein [Marinifilum sp. N1E240]
MAKKKATETTKKVVKKAEEQVTQEVAIETEVEVKKASKKKLTLLDRVSEIKYVNGEYRNESGTIIIRKANISATYYVLFNGHERVKRMDEKEFDTFYKKWKEQ